ncbi:TRAP transporter small permease [Metabacillus idriensis]|nr:TRAP transporter small permease [Metabacillus idriensis]MCM3598045.1 TRAP transporter small permease [Metabacillus idriensis]
MNVVKKIDRNFEEYVCIVLFSIMTLLISAQIFTRFIFNYPLEWTEELARFIFIWLVYISISLAAKHNRHLKMEIGESTIAKKTGNWIYYFSDLCWLTFNIFMIFYGTQMVQSLLSSIQVSAVTRINMGAVYTIVPFGFALMSLRIIQNMIKRKNTSSEPEHIQGSVIHNELEKHPIKNIQ